MNMNLVAISGVPPADLSGKLVGVGGGCGCTGMGDTSPTDDQKTALDWAAVGFWSVAIVMGYFLMRAPARGR